MNPFKNYLRNPLSLFRICEYYIVLPIAEKSRIDNANNVIKANAGLGNVSGQDDLTFVSRSGEENLLEVIREQVSM